MATGYLSDLPGIHDVRDHGGVVLPRRNVLAIFDANVRDVGAETQVRARAPHLEHVVSTAGGAVLLENVDADAYLITAATGLRGLGVPIAGGRRKVWIINGTGSALALTHDDAGTPAQSRFANVGGLTIPAQLTRMILRTSADRWLVAA